MKILGLAIAIILSLGGNVAFAQVYVHGYTRSDGTYVQGYTRSSPNSTVTDNYSFYGNTNPYTGETGSDYYRHDTTSGYFNGTPYSNGEYGHSNTYSLYGY